MVSLSNCVLGMCLAFCICCMINRPGYPLAVNMFLSVVSSLRKWYLVDMIRLYLIICEYMMFRLMWNGWWELKCRIRFLSVGFL